MENLSSVPGLVQWRHRVNLTGTREAEARRERSVVPAPFVDGPGQLQRDRSVGGSRF